MKKDSRRSLWIHLWRAETPRDRRNLSKYIGTMLVWGVVFAVATHLIESGNARGPATWALVAVGSLTAALVVRSYWRYLLHADELARTIQLHALAGALMAGFVSWTVLRLLAAAGVDPGGWPSPTALVVIAFYVIGTVHGLRRYR